MLRFENNVYSSTGFKNTKQILLLIKTTFLQRSPALPVQDFFVLSQSEDPFFKTSSSTPAEN